MWILIKFVVALAAFFYKFLSKHFGSFGDGESVNVQGIPVFISTEDSKGNIHTTTFEIKFDSKYVFKFTKETWFDRWMKTLGVAIEIQSGEKNFDNHIYVASDSRTFMQQVCREAQVRELITNLFLGGCKHIHSDGRSIQIEFSGDQSSNQEFMNNFIQLYAHIAKIKIRSPYSFDVFAVKALFLEAAIWSIAAYSLVGFLEFTFSHVNTYVHPMPIFIQGLWMGGIISALLIFFVILMMRGSSRGHRLIVESIIVLGLALPFVGFNTVSDVNMALDDSNSVIEESKVINRYEKKHRRGRRGGSYYTYHIQIDQFTTPDTYHIARDIKIPHADYLVANVGDQVRIEIGQGKLKHPYYRSFLFKRP
ncbi:MAG: hypothetical protein IT286_01845 [Proteobacteria bacterium]|nr:hypothetical protein [Pseudomonadota bacterium]